MHCTGLLCYSRSKYHDWWSALTIRVRSHCKLHVSRIQVSREIQMGASDTKLESEMALTAHYVVMLDIKQRVVCFQRGFYFFTLTKFNYLPHHKGHHKIKNMRPIPVTVILAMASTQVLAACPKPECVGAFWTGLSPSSRSGCAVSFYLKYFCRLFSLADPRLNSVVSLCQWKPGAVDRLQAAYLGWPVQL